MLFSAMAWLTPELGGPTQDMRGPFSSFSGHSTSSYQCATFSRVCKTFASCLPGAQTAIQSSTGMTWSQLTSTNPRFASFLASTLVDDGISGVGLAIFGMIVSLTGFRRGEKWAWYVSWAMPIGILAAQLNVYLLTASVLVIVLGVVLVLGSLLALFSPYRQFFPKKMRHVS